MIDLSKDQLQDTITDVLNKEHRLYDMENQQVVGTNYLPLLSEDKWI